MIRKAEFARRKPVLSRLRGQPDPVAGVLRHSGGPQPQSDRGPLHFHMLCLDGIYVEVGHGKLQIQRLKAPNIEELKALVYAISHRVAGLLERRGY